MHISEKNLIEIEKVAHEKRNAEVLLLIEILREIQQTKGLLEQRNYTSDCCNNGANSANNCNNKYK